jgi:hypothetical protein
MDQRKDTKMAKKRKSALQKKVEELKKKMDDLKRDALPMEPYRERKTPYRITNPLYPWDDRHPWRSEPTYPIRPKFGPEVWMVVC